MTPDPRPSYPRTPAYGEGYRPGGEGPRSSAVGDRAWSEPAVPAVEPHGVGLVLALSVAVNLLVLVGVLALGWPAGNAFLLFWCENVVLGLVTLVRIGTAEVAPAGRVGVALFFCLHYGIFCAVHLGFTAFVAFPMGVELSFPALGLPVALVVVRYAVELLRTWFGPDGLRRATSPRQAMTAPYPRVVVLHVAVLVVFALTVAGLVSGVPGAPATPALQRVLSLVRAGWGGPKVLAVVVLVAVKTLVDVLTTRRALRPR